jgi:hypothetical protein
MVDDAQPADDQSDLERRLTDAMDSLPSGWAFLRPPYTVHGESGRGTACFYGPAGADPPTIVSDGSPHIVAYLYPAGAYVPIPMPIPTSRPKLYRARSHDVVIDAPKTVDEAQFKRFVSALLDAPA